MWLKSRLQHQKEILYRMKAESKLSRLVLVTPWPLLVFLVIPILVILSITLNINLPLAGPKPLLVNNFCFAFLVACRLFRYLYRLGKGIRYGAEFCKPKQSLPLSVPAADVRASLSGAGFIFAADGGYGEKKDSGYLGTTVMYAGLLILLATGTWDSLHQFSGVLLDGMGPATNLNKAESYHSKVKGAWAAIPSSLPQMQILKQFLPDATYPMGATEVALIAADGKTEKIILKPRVPYSVGSYDIYMGKIVFEPQIVIKNRDSLILFDSFVRLDPLVQKRGPYSFYGLFQGDILGGGVYYQPEKSSLMVVISRNGEKVVTDMVFQVDQQAVAGEYILSCAKMGQWSQIHVVHRRHKGLLLTGAIIAIIGLLLRIAIRPQRIWLDESASGSTICVTGREALALLRDENRH